MPEQAQGWSWRDNIINNGYVLSAVKDINVRAEKILEPTDYNAASLEYDEPIIVADNYNYPDIILILNETFCDLNYYAGIEADIDYMGAFKSIKNVIIGNAVTPGIGGGTNTSEFELLMSKSMNILPDSSPFLYLKSNITKRSIVQYLNKLGYNTTAMHCGASTNYSRSTIYPVMEFDEIYLGPEAFKHFSNYGNRVLLDSDNYTDLIEHYESCKSDTPQFIYLLTLQNHGGWEQNEDGLDIVHVLGEYGDLTDDINEYLTSIKLSSDAFADLIDYYSKVDRNVIICMVGDHAPSFITKLNANHENKQMPDDMAQRIVPYIIWSNYCTLPSSLTDYASMTDLVPMILKSANISLCSFYSTLLNLHEQFPVRLKNGIVMDSEGNLFTVDEINGKKINQYYQLEYNSLMEDDEYREELFDIASSK